MLQGLYGHELCIPGWYEQRDSRLAGLCSLFHDHEGALAIIQTDTNPQAPPICEAGILRIRLWHATLSAQGCLSSVGSPHV